MVDGLISTSWASASLVSRCSVEQLTKKRISDPAVHELASRVEVHADEEMDKLYPQEWPVLVEITLKDGRRVGKRLDKVIGCPRRPMTDAELSAKFLGNTEPVLGPKQAQRVLEACMSLEEIESAAELVSWLEPEG